WPSLFSGIDIIANRITPRHQDQGSCAEAYDLLVSIGEGHDARLDLCDFKASIGYGPGTLVFLTGRVLRHSVAKWSRGERIVVA
ncbi:hypothetical protein HYDPIDRAFT_67266, partial [Hydnomerulius pinastri MD-312]